MAMRSATSPRRIYVRAGRPLVCYGGVYFAAPKDKESKLNIEKEVSIEVLDNAGGRKRIKVTQGTKNKVHETWSETKITVEKRATA